ncbi:MAG TPA: hypothetical protein VM536_16915, partial [Chloroflexia bacterium]|nr:hypothetical protein [Chloroflexia bacterium]
MRRYRRLLRYAWPYRGAWALLTVLTLLSTALALLQPWPLKVLIDSVLVAVPGTPGAELPFLPGATTREALLAWVVAAGLGIFLLNSAVDVILTFIWVGTGQRLVY